MGVRGLQTFLKENRQSLCRSVLLDADGKGERERTPIVVDAWGIIYQLYLDSLPWTSGGEYYRFYRLTCRLIKAWRNVGLEPTFIFDGEMTSSNEKLTPGASPPEKHATILERLQQSVNTCRMFYTISPPTRSAPSFSRYKTILPPFTLHTFSRALSDLDVAARYVPAGEADGMCVVVADQLGGYVFGHDTDFIILATGASDSMKGYVPLDMLEWIEGSPSRDEETSGQPGFTTVKGGRKAPVRLSRLLPPSNYRNPTLVLATYTAPAFCRRLRLPANLMPLFSSLVGNDYTPPSVTDAFFVNGINAVERIERVARILREQQLARAVGSSNHGDAAANFVKRVVAKLCIKPYVDDRVVDEIVDSIIEATIQYVLPTYGECCSMYPFCGDNCSAMSRVATPLSTPVEVSPAMAAYASAQRRGDLNTATSAWLYPNRVYLWSVFEDPSGPNARGGACAIAARTAAYLFIEEALGGLRFPAATTDQLDEITQDLIVLKLLDVDGTNGNEEGGDSEEEAVKVQDMPSQRIVMEYLRQGSSGRIKEHCITLPAPLDNATPTCVAPLEQRLKAYRAHMGADTPEIAALPPKLQPLAAVVRLCIVQAADCDASGSRKWRKPEIEAVLRGGIGCLEGGWGHLNAKGEEMDEIDGDYPLLTNRNAEIVAQLTAGFTEGQLLAQSLLLAPNESDSRLTHLTPFVFISGVTLHYLLSGTEPPASARTGWRWSALYKHAYHATLSAVLASLPESAIGSGSRPEPKKKERRAPPPRNPSPVKATGSRFDLLMGSNF